MDISALIALASQELAELDKICPPENIRDKESVGTSIESAKSLAGSIRNHIRNIERKISNQLFDKGILSQKLSANLRGIYLEQLKPRALAIKQANQILDPDMAEFDDILDQVGFPRGGNVTFTFEVAIERMYQLIDDNPELEGDFAVGSADKCLESELIRFDPDTWLKNAADLFPVIARGENHEIPIQLKVRLLEIFRSFVFENNISVLCLARAALEYTIYDNLNRFDICPTYQETGSKHGNKDLCKLIDEVGAHMPECKDAMHQIRKNGNTFIHPKKTRDSKSQLFERAEKARWTIQELVNVISRIYGFRTKGK